LRSLNADQKVSLPDDTVSRDAIALASAGKHCCIQLFQIRAGRLVGRLGFFADGESGDPGAILQRVLEEHYWQADPTEIPSEISLQHELPEAEILTQWLQEKKGRKVSLAVPQRQSKAELIEMVERNAQYELERTQRFADRTVQSLVDLAEILDLPDLPRRIEGYDISHLQGSNAVASQVVFTDGVPAKQLYRHYKIKNPEIQIGHSDDFASLAEVISRRFRRYLAQAGEDPPLEMNAKTAKTAKPLLSSALDLPDLILIDGGKGQLSAVVAVLQEMNLLDQVRVVSLAKKREEIFLPGESQPLPTDPDQPGLHLLRSVRDEAHRFAVSFHRQQRMAQGRRSRLQDIPGLGFQRQKLLLAHFHSIDYIREASLEQLMAVSGIGQQVAQEIFTYFHP
jgi:excinuclease ABC subunit C